MPDVHDRETRSRNMSAIKAKNTEPELLIRKMLHKKGFRYRIHDKSLPGKPDLVFPKYNAVIQVHGCFWHQHNCHLFKWPKARQEFWRNKISGNYQKDRETEKLLLKEGWRILTVWECAIKGRTRKPIENVINQCAAWLVQGKQCAEIIGQ